MIENAFLSDWNWWMRPEVGAKYPQNYARVTEKVTIPNLSQTL